MGADKSALRQMVWQRLMRSGVARFPLPVYGRIPNFVGAEQAARRLSGLKEYQEAQVVFCNPDSPQRPVREMVLRDGKTLVMATPRLRRGLRRANLEKCGLLLSRFVWCCWVVSPWWPPTSFPAAARRASLCRIPP